MLAFTEHINSVDSDIKLTLLTVTNSTFLDCDEHNKRERRVLIGKYKKTNTHTDKYRLFDSQHSLEYKLRVIKTLQNKAVCHQTPRLMKRSVNI